MNQKTYHLGVGANLHAHVPVLELEQMRATVIKEAQAMAEDGFDDMELCIAHFEPWMEQLGENYWQELGQAIPQPEVWPSPSDSRIVDALKPLGKSPWLMHTHIPLRTARKTSHIASPTLRTIKPMNNRQTSSAGCIKTKLLNTMKTSGGVGLRDFLQRPMLQLKSPCPVTAPQPIS